MASVSKETIRAFPLNPVIDCKSLKHHTTLENVNDVGLLVYTGPDVFVESSGLNNVAVMSGAVSSRFDKTPIPVKIEGQPLKIESRPPTLAPKVREIAQDFHKKISAEIATKKAGKPSTFVFSEISDSQRTTIQGKIIPFNTKVDSKNAADSDAFVNSLMEAGASKALRKLENLDSVIRHIDEVVEELKSNGVRNPLYTYSQWLFSESLDEINSVKAIQSNITRQQLLAFFDEFNFGKTHGIIDLERLRMFREASRGEFASWVYLKISERLGESPAASLVFKKSMVSTLGSLEAPSFEFSAPQLLELDPSSQPLNITFQPLSFTLRVGLPALGVIGALEESIALYRNPYADYIEQDLGLVTSLLSLGTLGAGIREYHLVRYGSQVANLNLPLLGAFCNAFDVGTKAAFDFNHPEYGSQKRRLGLDVVSGSSGFMALWGGYIGSANPLTGGLLVALGAGAAIGSNLAHDSVTKNGIAQVIAKEISKQIHNKETNNGYSFDYQINFHLNVAKAYRKFDDDTVFELLKSLKNKQISLDWKNEGFLTLVRDFSFEALRQDETSWLSFFGDEEAAALLFFGMHSSPEKQCEAIRTFLREVKASDRHQVWSNFAAQYGLTEKYGDLLDLYESLVDDEVKLEFGKIFSDLT